MKRNNILYRIAALLLFVTLTAACTNEDDYAAPGTDGTTPATPLTITVTDGAYASAETPDGGNTPGTRAVERGYGTEFTKGDQIGLYVVAQEDASNQYSNRTFLQQNLCLTHDGTDWTLPAGTELTYQPPEGGEILYFAYYPYQGGMTDKVNIYAKNENDTPTTEARWFFRELIEDWTPAADQRTYEAYTASDLMVARGEVAKRTDGTDGFVLSFTMEHQMALAVIRVPTTKYTYSETIDGKPIEKSYRLYSGLDAKAWLADDNTYRRIIKWNMAAYDIEIAASYYNSSLERRSFLGTINPNSAGKYFLFTVDDGEETVTNRALREGDFYMKDGGILPHDAFPGGMPADVKKDCLGVVFWVGENEGIHWTQTDLYKGDHLLMRDHPGCVHGMVVALKDASAGAAWATDSGASENLFYWGKSFDGFTDEEQAVWQMISNSSESYGYNKSRIMKLYDIYHSTTTFPAYNAIDGYAGRHPVPGNSSGWFFPSLNELTMMCYGMVSNYEQKPTTRRDFLNCQFQKAGGKVFDGGYWSSLDDESQAWYLNFAGKTTYDFHPKSNTYKVRAVLAF